MDPAAVVVDGKPLKDHAAPSVDIFDADGMKLGRIVWHAKDKELYATCADIKCGCKKTKTRRVTPNDAKPAQGRPLGYLMAWLCCDKGGFDAITPHKDYVPDPDTRLRHREKLEAVTPAAVVKFLFSKERDRRLPDEGPEPATCP